MKAKSYFIIGLLVAAFVLPALSYVLPDVTAVKVVSTQNKKREGSDDQLRVRTIAVNEDGTINLDNTLVFRNEDAILLPPYLKYDSEDLQTKFDAWAVKNKDYADGPTVYIKSYGWRVKWLSMFPNATSAWVE